APGGRVDRLTVDARRRSGVVGLLHRADLAAKEVVELLQGPVSSPLVEVTPDGALGWEVHGQIAPLAAGAEDAKDGVEDVPYVGLAGPSAGVDRRDVRLDQGPLCVGDVAGIMVRSHPISTSLEPLLFPLWDRLLVQLSMSLYADEHDRLDARRPSIRRKWTWPAMFCAWMLD